METLLSFVAGGLFASGIYLILRRNIIRVIIGMVLISNAANLSIFVSGRLTRANPPLIAADAYVPEGAFANPLPQALILTAIVIGFGLLAFSLVLAYRANQELGTVDPDEMRVAEPPYEKAMVASQTDPLEQGVSR